MKYLLDASALIPLLLDYGEKLLDKVTKVVLYVTDLTFYEAGNSLWKLVMFLNTMKLEEAKDILHALSKLIESRVLEVIHFRELDLCRIIKLAISERITFYDASYIVASERAKATLVTEDRKLREKAKKYVSTTTYTLFIQEIGINH